MPQVKGALFLAILAALPGHAQDLRLVINIGSRRELFADGHLVGRLSGGAKLHVLRPEPKEVVLTTDAPWEGNTFY